MFSSKIFFNTKTKSFRMTRKAGVKTRNQFKKATNSRREQMTNPLAGKQVQNQKAKTKPKTQETAGT